MKLKILLSTEVLVDEEVVKVTAEAENGSFCRLPRHIDFVAALVPGLLSFVRSGDDGEEFLAVDSPEKKPPERTEFFRQVSHKEARKLKAKGLKG